MPVISKVGRSSPGIRLILILMYALLLVGSATMIGPFLMMLAGSISSEADISDYRIVPKFLSNDTALLARYLNDKYYGELVTVKDLYRYELSRIDVRTGTVAEMVRALGLREKLADPVQRRLVAEYGEFLSRHIPVELYQAGFNLRGGLIGPVNQWYQECLKKRFSTITEMNRAYGEQTPYWAEVIAPLERIAFRDWSPVYHQRYRDYLEFKKTMPAWQRQPFEGARKWVEQLRLVSDGNIQKLNKILGTNHEDYYQIPLPLTAPDDPVLLGIWEDFVRRKWPLRLIQVNVDGLREYRSFIQERRKTIEKVNAAYKTRYAGFDDIPWPEGELFEGVRQSDFIDFLKGTQRESVKLSMKNVTLRTASAEFRKWLLTRHGGNLEGINAALGARFSVLEDILIPQPLWEWNEMVSARGHWRWEFVKANYFEVGSFILTKGRALINTVVFIAISIAVTLTVNPLCAYALSRFNLSYAYKVLLFLLATMAFPGEVTMIPNFLLLRDLGMLNTFYALILPGMASGFSIFLLKGFFDTLPKELYEAAQLDGAGELRMFYQITVPLCRPVFAYIALITFTGAYGAFLFALTVCQDPAMWTIMVWLYDLNTSAPEHIKVAALVLAMLPTLLVFVTCQRVIMRGIVLPQMQ
ncbi:MAG: carbohydrate ABC transporter permease [Verrucomicrobia bacterium]|nr:carbohydrate ABC transporter permease [Verrucomicrobiota bacterium]